jgi:hypothetical protein
MGILSFDKGRRLHALRGARARISSPTNWCRGAGARDTQGQPCGSFSTNAVCWCVGGAIERECAQDFGFRMEVEALVAKHAGCGARTLHKWNDEKGRTHGEVVAAVDAAIAELEER